MTVYGLPIEWACLLVGLRGVTDYLGSVALFTKCQATGYRPIDSGPASLQGTCKLFHRVAFQEDCLLQSAEKLLVGQGVLDSTKVKLSTGSDDELGIVALTNGGREAD